MASSEVFRLLREIARRPACFERYEAADLWTDEHMSSSMMLVSHLNGAIDVSLRKTAFIDRSVAGIVSRSMPSRRSPADWRS